MRRKIPLELRRQVAERARFCCEFCGLEEAITYEYFHIDHLLSIKHGGISALENLAYSFPDCNRYKGSNLGTYVDDQEELTRLFNPRKDVWNDHFEIFEGAFYPKTAIGTATINVLRLNDADRIIIRQEIAKDKASS